MHHVGQVEDERRLRHVHRRAVRLQRVGDRAHGVLVLLEVLRRARERGGERQVAVVVARTSDRAGQHARGHQAALAAHQHLGGGAEDAVDVEGPAHLVVLGEAVQRPAHVEGYVGGGDEVAGQDHLLEVARPDAADCLRDDRHPLLAVERAVGEDEAHGRVGRGGGGEHRLLDRDRGEPGAVTAPADDHLRDHQHGLAGLVGEREGAEAHQPGAGLVDAVVDLGARDGLGPPLHRVAEPGVPGGLQACRDSPSDQALAAAQPADRLLPGKQVEEREVRQVHRDGAHHEGRGGSGDGGGRGGRHEAGAYAGGPNRSRADGAKREQDGGC